MQTTKKTMRMMVAVILSVIVFAPATAIAKDISISWDASTATDLAGYKIYRAEMVNGQTGPWGDPIANIEPGVTTYTDLAVSDTKRFAYLVTAYDNDGNESMASNLAYEEKDNTPPAPVGGCSITLK